jgi:competence CoiA-like predicted nuclease
MAPPGGRHNPQSLDHSAGKNALRGWAASQGFTARVEAWTADGRRRSDVEVILPDGVRVAIELQCSEITDTEWVTRHEDYIRAGITDVWFWHPRLRVPGFCSSTISQAGVSTWRRERSGCIMPNPILSP